MRGKEGGGGGKQRTNERKKKDHSYSTFCPFSQHSSSPRMHISTVPANLLAMLSSNRTKKTHWRISLHSVRACTKGAEFAAGTVT